MYYYKKNGNSKWQKSFIKELFKNKKGKNNYSDIILKNINLLENKVKYLPNTLYKFYSPTSDNILDIKNRRLWLSHPSSFNDPFDCQTGYDPLEYEKHALMKILNHIGCVDETDKMNGFTSEEMDRI